MAKKNEDHNKSYLNSVKEKSTEYAKLLNHPYVGTEHLMLALLSDSASVVSTYFKAHGVTLKSFKSILEQLIGKGTNPENFKGSFTPLLENLWEDVAEYATTEEIKITPELITIHILWLNEGTGIRLLDSLNFNQEMREGMEEFLEAYINIQSLSFDSCNSGNGLGDDKTFKCLTDMHEQVKENRTIVTGLDDELEQLIKSLLRYKKPNVIILGEPGVGKTALVEKLALAINNKEVPPIIQDFRVVQLSLNSALAGTRYRGDFEEKIEKILNTVSRQKNIILFIDEIHNIVGAGAAGNTDSTLDAANILKPYLARGSLKIIGATTTKEYEYIKKDGALARRFRTLEILEPSKEQTMNILKSMKPAMLEAYGVRLTDKQLNDIYYDSTFRKGRMPDVALDEMEEFCVDIYYNKSKQEMKERVSVDA